MLKHVLINYILCKGGLFTIHEKICAEKKRLDTKIKSLKNELQKLPDGHLVCSRNENRYKWYHSDGKTKSYIPKANRPLAEQLAIKKYLSLSLEDLENEANAIDFYLRHYSPSTKAEQLLTQPSEYKNLLKSHFQPLSQELSDWMHAPYEQNPFHPEHLIHKSTSGNILRSKSEAMIDMLLYVNQIPFRYECALHLDYSTIFPDFTIRHPQTGALFYWEHFGLMEDPTYSRNAFAKLQQYTSHGIIPSIQLITTYETLEHPLTTEVIQKIIEHYFL